MVSALAAHFTARAPHANTVQLPAGGQHRSSAATVRRTRYPARSTYPPRPALTSPLPTLPCGQRRAAPGHVIGADHGRSVGTVDMWIARISASSAAPSRVRISMLARHPSCGPGASRGPDFHSLPPSENPARANITPVCGMHAFRKCSILRPTPSSSGYADRPRSPEFIPMPH